MKVLYFFIGLMLSAIALSGQTNIPEIDQEIKKGNFNKAQQMIQEVIAAGALSAEDNYQLSLQSALLDRIRIDFNRDEAYVRETLATYYPELSDDQLQAWEASNELEMCHRIDIDSYIQRIYIHRSTSYTPSSFGRISCTASRRCFPFLYG